MKLKIKNYKNINKLDFIIEDNKVNFIYGLSGSGKSSICEVLMNDDCSNKKTFGYSQNEQIISISPKIKKEDILYFDNTSRGLFIDSNDGNQLYRVLFANDESVFDIYNNLMNYLMGLSSLRPLLFEYLDNIKSLKKELGMRSNAVNIDGKNNNITKLENEMNSNKYKTNYNCVKKHGLNYLNWIKEGTNLNEYRMGKCPFCNRKMSEYRIEYINNVVDLTPENYNAIVSSNSYMNIFNIDEPNYTSKRDINRVKKKIKEVIDSEREVNELLKMFDCYKTNDLNINNLTSIKLSKIIKEQLPLLSDEIDKYNSNLKDIKNKAKWLNSHTNKLIKNNLTKLNKYLKLLGIPYEFLLKRYDNEKKEVSAFLVHVDNNKTEDNRKALSYGETNIISLLLFILSINKKYVIIDDPASSFDENRRTVLYNLIMENFKNETIIVLSHDQSFVKNAIINKLNNRNINKIGKLYYLYYYDKNNYLNEIETEDLDSISNHIVKRLKSENLCYFQKIINIRILAEIRCRKNSKMNHSIYEYLSAILHGHTNTEIKELLKSKGTTEEEILKQIKIILDVNLEKQPNDIMKEFDYSKLSLFEKVAYKREILNKRKKVYKTIKKYAVDILSEIVHLNEETIYTLNPYKYCMYPQNVIDIVEDKII